MKGSASVKTSWMIKCLRSINVKLRGHRVREGDSALHSLAKVVYRSDQSLFACSSF